MSLPTCQPELRDLSSFDGLRALGLSAPIGSPTSGMLKSLYTSHGFDTGGSGGQSSTSINCDFNPHAAPFSLSDKPGLRAFNPEAKPFTQVAPKAPARSAQAQEASGIMGPARAPKESQLRESVLKERLHDLRTERWADMSCSSSERGSEACVELFSTGNGSSGGSADGDARRSCFQAHGAADHPRRAESRPLSSLRYSFSAADDIESPGAAGQLATPPRGPSQTVGFQLDPVSEASSLATGNPMRELMPCNQANLRVSVPIDNSGRGLNGGQRKHGYAGALTLLQSLNMRGAGDGDKSPKIEAVFAMEQDRRVKHMIRSAVRGMRAQQEPEAARDGMGGTYFLHDEAGAKAAIFKPCDEEPLAPNNPKGWEGRAMGAPGMKPCVRVGEAALREVAAYLLDHDGFAGVPPACLVHCYHPVLNYKVLMPKIESLMDMSVMNAASPSGAHAPFLRSVSDQAVDAPPPPPAFGGLAQALQRRGLWADASAPSSPTRGAAGADGGRAARPAAAAQPGDPKLGSLQAFVPHKCDANDMSPSHFSADNVHRVGILDLRLLNCDRHAGNLLVSKAAKAQRGDVFARGPTYTLIPIDHGYALPEALDDPYLEWLFWPQASVPFSDEVKAYVARLDVAADVAMLRRLMPSLREECLRCLEVTTTVLQMCTEANLTLFEIGSIMSRSENSGEQMPSDLEVMCMDAREEALAMDLGPSPPNGSPTLGALSSPGRGADASPQSAALQQPLQLQQRRSLTPCLEEEEEEGRERDGARHVPDREDVFDGLFEAESPCYPTPSMLESLSSLEPQPGLLRCNLSHPDEALCGMLSAPASHAAPIMCARRPGPVRLTSSSQGSCASPIVAADGGRARLIATVTSLPSFGRNLGGALDACSDFSTDPSNAVACMAQLQGTWADPSDVKHGRMVRRNAWRVKQNMRQGKLSYPPLLLAAHPDKANYVFTGLTDRQWLVFMDRISVFVKEELHQGTWKASRGRGQAVAGSCPVAFNNRLR